MHHSTATPAHTGKLTTLAPHPAHRSPVEVEHPTTTLPTHHHHRTGNIGKWETTRRVTDQQARRTMQRLTDSSRLKSCGVRPIAGAAEVTLDISNEGSARFGKLQTCKSRWLCPFCGPRLAKARAAQVAKMAEAHVRNGGAVAMAVLNQPHFWKDSLEWLVGVDKAAWGKLTGNNTWKGPNGIRKRYGVTLPPVWALEDTHGSQGWNWHRNVLLFLDRPLSETEVEALEAELYELWARVVVKAGGRRPSAAQGVKVAQAGDVEGAAAMGAYAVKADAEKEVTGIALEVMGGEGKSGRKGRTHLQVLRDITAAYEAGEEPVALDIRIWQEWLKFHLENITQRSQVPKVLEELLEVAPVDEDAALEEEPVEEDVVDDKPRRWSSVVGVSNEVWKKHLAYDLALQEEVCAAACAAGRRGGGVDLLAARLAAVGVLERAGVPYRVMEVDLSPGVDMRAWRTDIGGARGVLEGYPPPVAHPTLRN